MTSTDQTTGITTGTDVNDGDDGEGKPCDQELGLDSSLLPPPIITYNSYFPVGVQGVLKPKNHTLSQSVNNLVPFGKDERRQDPKFPFHPHPNMIVTHLILDLTLHNLSSHKNNHHIKKKNSVRW